jgi:hypothetical protein
MPRGTSTTTTPEERLEAVLSTSGHNLHLRTVTALQGAGWHVELSAYFYDDTDPKPREIDIIASRQVPVRQPSGETVNTFQTSLFIECKYFKEEIAFRMQPASDYQAAIKLRCPWNINLEELAARHRYGLIGEVGKLYDQHNPADLFSAITQPVKSLTFFRDRAQRTGLYYPITVYEGIDGIYHLDPGVTTLTGLTRKKYSVFGLSYTYRNVSSVYNELNSEIFYIDFVHKDEFPDLLTAIAVDEIALSELMHEEWHRRAHPSQ